MQSQWMITKRRLHDVGARTLPLLVLELTRQVSRLGLIGKCHAAIVYSVTDWPVLGLENVN